MREPGKQPVQVDSEIAEWKYFLPVQIADQLDFSRRPHKKCPVEIEDGDRFRRRYGRHHTRSTF